MSETVTLERPEWWRPGLPLPAISAITRHTGQGKINGMKEFGAAQTTLIPVRWETTAEWRARTGIAD